MATPALRRCMAAMMPAMPKGLAPLAAAPAARGFATGVTSRKEAEKEVPRDVAGSKSRMPRPFCVGLGTPLGSKRKGATGRKDGTADTRFVYSCCLLAFVFFLQPTAVLDASAQTLFITELARGMSLALKYFFTKKVTVRRRRKLVPTVFELN